MIASLPMYERPSNKAAHDRLWNLIRDGLRDRGIAAPDRLDRAMPYRSTWAQPNLVLGQICNLPYRAEYRATMTRIGAADYGLEGCPDGYYRSVLVVRHDDPRQSLASLQSARFAANALHSYSGYAVAEEMAQASGIALPAPVITGSHDASVQAVADGTVDFAFIDQQTWVMQQTDLPQVDRVRAAAYSPVSPGQSFVTRTSSDPTPYFDAVADAIVALDSSDRGKLGLRGIVALDDAAFDLPLPRVYA